MIANRTLIGHKCHHVIEAYAELTGVPIREAIDVFYKSDLYSEITGGISDMHCRSDGYLAEELQLEVERVNRSQESEDRSQKEKDGRCPTV
ncbi:MAG: hypothetical protein LBI05_04015 [Planctomycetaceae bacterium]|jgi:hypothetical protein|nr:hypothetical protein [Planctomycetaceae bacterium]